MPTVRVRPASRRRSITWIEGWRRSLLPVAAALSIASCQPAEDPAADAVGAPTGDVPASGVATITDTSEATADGPAGDPAARPDESVPLTADGWGPLRIGMTRAEVFAAAGEDADPTAVGGPEPDQCEELRPSRAPERMLVMIERGRLTRISLLSRSAVKTGEGFGVGDAAAEVVAGYGERAEVGPHKYSPAPAVYITVWRTDPSSPDARGIVYEVGRDGRVSHIHAGGPSIRYVEGCL